MLISNEKSPDTREQILNTALQLFAEQGYHKTKISDIVKTVGVAQGTFYWYFKSKEAIALEIIKNGQEELLQFIAKGTANQEERFKMRLRHQRNYSKTFSPFQKKIKL